jgi:Fic family protein
MIQTGSLEITPEMLVLVAEIDEFKGAWRALGTLAPERLSALRRVATIESIGSSTRIEGSRLSDREVERLLSNLEIKSFGSRDEQEVAGYAEVMETVFAFWSDIPSTENHIKQLHRDLLRYSDKDERHRGPRSRCRPLGLAGCVVRPSWPDTVRAGSPDYARRRSGLRSRPHRGGYKTAANCVAAFGTDAQ